jgi:trans-2-enoyl-CoA reductase
MKQLRISSYGNPLDNVFLSEGPSVKLRADCVRLKILYSPINPADINMCEGKYSTQPTLPSVLGNEGIGVVIEVGALCNIIRIGQRVIVPLQTENDWLGFWQEDLCVLEDRCIVVPEFIADEQAAMLTVNPMSAYMMLSFFVKLKKGDWIIQNLSNSAVGKWVLCLADLMGIHVVSVARSESYREELLSLGAADFVLDREDFSQNCPNKGLFRLALNGVGGSSAKELAKSLANDATLVTYGAMSKEPLIISNSLLIYKNIGFKGFNRSSTLLAYDMAFIKRLYDDLFELLFKRRISIPVSIYSVEQYMLALEHAIQADKQEKVLLRFF